MEQIFIGNAIGLVQYSYDWFVVYFQFFQNFFHGGNLVFKLAVAGINHMHKYIRFEQFVQCRPKSGEQFVRQIADKAYRIGNNCFGILRKAQPGAFCIQCGKEFVFNQNGAFGESIEECGFAGIGIADDGNDR